MVLQGMVYNNCFVYFLVKRKCGFYSVGYIFSFKIYYSSIVYLAKLILIAIWLHTVASIFRQSQRGWYELSRFETYNMITIWDISNSVLPVMLQTFQQAFSLFRHLRISSNFKEFGLPPFICLHLLNRSLAIGEIQAVWYGNKWILDFINCYKSVQVI